MLPPFSPIGFAARWSVADGAGSSSSTVRVTGSGSATPLPPVTRAATSSRLSGPSSELSTPVMVTVPVLSIAPAAIVSRGSELRLMSASCAGSTGVTAIKAVVA